MKMKEERERERTGGGGGGKSNIKEEIMLLISGNDGRDVGRNQSAFVYGDKNHPHFISTR